MERSFLELILHGHSDIARVRVIGLIGLLNTDSTELLARTWCCASDCPRPVRLVSLVTKTTRLLTALNPAHVAPAYHDHTPRHHHSPVEQQGCHE